MTLTAPRTTPTWTPTWRTRTAFGWILLSALAIAVLAPLRYWLDPLADLAANGQELAANYADRSTAVRLAFYLHIAGGGLALLLSPVQFLPGLRARAPGLHRVVGRVVLTAIAVGGAAGLVLAPLSLAGLVGTLGFGLLAVLWVTFAAFALRAIRRGDVSTHRRWMVRTFALTYAAVTLRLWLALLIPLQMGLAGVDERTAFSRAYLLVPFLAWVPNLLVAEWYLATRGSTTGQSGRVERSPAIAATRPSSPGSW